MQGTGQSADVMERIEEILAEYYENRVYSVEEDVVWVSGLNANSGMLARRMAKELTAQGIPCSLVYDDDAAAFGGLEFRWGDAA